MKRKIGMICVLVLAAPLLCGAAGLPAGNGAPALAAPSVSGVLHVDGAVLTGEDGEPVQLRGVSTHGLAWFPEYVNIDCFR